MEDQSKAIAWALSQNSTLDLSVQRLSWIDDVFAGYTDIHCSISIAGCRYHGWGADRSEDTALCKALAECFERAAAVRHHAWTSNGFAAHVDLAEAEDNARSELIERDGFLSHFLSRTPFRPFDRRRLPSVDFDLIDRWSESLGLRVRLYELGPDGVLCVVDGLARPSPFGFVVGASVKSDIQAAARSAIVEAARSATYATRHLTTIDLIQFEALERPDFDHHAQLALDLSYAESIADLFPDVSLEVTYPKPAYLSEDEVSVEVLDLDIGSGPFVFARAASPNAQGLWLGHPKHVDIQLKRLSTFTGRDLKWSGLNLLPHPFG